MSTQNHQAPPKPSDHRSRLEQQLDEALAASFPASDPVSIVTSQFEEDWVEEARTSPPPAKP